MIEEPPEIKRTTIGITRDLLTRIRSYQIHPRETNTEIIERLLNLLEKEYGKRK